MQLSKRLQTVADTVTKGNSVADIGCDHAYIAIYLIEEAIAPKVIAMDINKGPLQRAEENIRAKRYEKNIETRLSDGLEKLNKSEVDTILMAGIGGALMIRILEDGDEVLLGSKELVLSPQSEINQVRKYLHKKNFAIVEEKMLLDEGKYYVVMKAAKIVFRDEIHNQEVQKVENLKEEYQKNEFQKEEYLVNEYQKEVFYQYGKLLLERKEPVLWDFLKREEKLNLEIIDKLKESPSQRSDVRMAEIEDSLSIINEAFSYYK